MMLGRRYSDGKSLRPRITAYAPVLIAAATACLVGIARAEPQAEDASVSATEATAPAGEAMVEPVKRVAPRTPGDGASAAEKAPRRKRGAKKKRK